VLVAVVVWGYGQLLQGARAGVVLSVALAVAAVAAAAIHGVFLALGRPEFRTGPSVAVLAAAFALSAAQAPLALRELAMGAGSPDGPRDGARGPGAGG
jgi:hypothetical protein